MATSLKESSTVTVKKLHPVIAAEVSGVDLSRELNPATVDTIKQAWHDHTVLVFHDQDLSGEDQLRFAANFGPIAERHQPKAGSKGDSKGSPEWVNLMPISDKTDGEGNAIGALGHGDTGRRSCWRRYAGLAGGPHRPALCAGLGRPAG